MFLFYKQMKPDANCWIDLEIIWSVAERSDRTHNMEIADFCQGRIQGVAHPGGGIESLIN